MSQAKVCHSENFDVSIIPYTDAIFISASRKSSHLGMMLCLERNPEIASINSQRTMLGDRDDLVTPIFAEKLASRLWAVLPSSINRAVLSVDLGRGLMMKDDTVNFIIASIKTGSDLF